MMACTKILLGSLELTAATAAVLALLARLGKLEITTQILLLAAGWLVAVLFAVAFVSGWCWFLW